MHVTALLGFGWGFTSRLIWARSSLPQFRVKWGTQWSPVGSGVPGQGAKYPNPFLASLHYSQLPSPFL